MLEGREGGEGKKEALSQTRTPGLLHLPGKKDLLLRSLSNATADVGRSVKGLGTSSFSTVTSLCQEVLRKVIISKHRELPKPPLQRGAGKGSEIPRKTQLRDSSYLVKSRIVGLFLCFFGFFLFVFFLCLYHKISLGTSVRGDAEKCSLSLLKTEIKQWLTTAGPAHHTISLFSIPEGACISLFSRLPSPALLSEETAGDRRLPHQAKGRGKH